MAKRLYQPKNTVYRFGEKQNHFISYLQSKYSDYSVYRTIGYVQSKFICEIVKQVTDKDIVYDVTNIDFLNKIMDIVRASEKDLKSHKMYSSAVNRYISFLTNK